MIASLFSLDEQESHLLALLSRNVPDVAGREYWTRIIDSEDALIVKLADRLANLLDLIAWVDRGVVLPIRLLCRQKSILGNMNSLYPCLLPKYFNWLRGIPIPSLFKSRLYIQ